MNKLFYDQNVHLFISYTIFHTCICLNVHLLIHFIFDLFSFIDFIDLYQLCPHLLVCLFFFIFEYLLKKIEYGLHLIKQCNQLYHK